MSIPITYKVDPGTMLGVIRDLRGMLTGVNAKWRRRAYEGATEEYALFSIRRFIRLSQGGGAWPPLKAATVRAKHGDRRINRDTDRLMRSLQRGLPGNVFAVDASGATYGTLVFYGPFVHARRKILVRPDVPTRLRMQGRALQAVDSAKNEAIAKARIAGRSTRPAA